MRCAPEVSPQTILLAGYYGFGNTGDEAILEAILAGLARRAPDARAVVISGDPKDTEDRHGVEAVPWRDLPGIARSVRASDLVIVGGGGLFQDHWGVDASTMLTPNHYGISFYAGPAILAALSGRPLALLGLGFGPLASDEARRIVRGVCEAASYLSVRDAASRDLLVESGVDAGRIVLSADAAFSLPPEELFSAAGPGPDLRAPVLGVVLRPWALRVDSAGWEAEVAGALDRFLEKTGGSVVFVPFQKSERLDEDDGAVASRVLGRLRHADRARALPEPGTPRETARLLARCDLVLAMRLHAAIFAVSSSIPVVAIAYDPKVRSLMARAGLSALVEPLEGLSGWSLQSRMESALEGGPGLRERLAAAAREQGRLARADLDAVAGLLERPPAPSAATDATRELIGGAVQSALRFSGEARGRIEEAGSEIERLRRRLAQAEAEAVVAASAMAATRDTEREADRREAVRLAEDLAKSQGEIHSLRSSRLWKAANLYWRARRLAARISHPARRILRRATGGAPSDWVGPDASHREAAQATPIEKDNFHEVVLFAGSEAGTSAGGLSALARRLAAEGHRVFSLSPRLRSRGPAYAIETHEGNLFGVSILAPPDGSPGASDAVFAAVDALRRGERLGATLSLVQDPVWILPARRLAEERAWPILETATEDPALAAEAFPRLSVVIVTYGNLDLSRLCLESLVARTEWPNLEIVVVDNGSADGTREWLEREEERLAPRLRVIAHAENRGFAAACNAGLSASTGEYLVLLNNDTVVPRGALTALVRHLAADPKLGLVGPVTNAIANEARVEVGYGGLPGMPEWAGRFMCEHDGEAFDIPMLALFCVALTRRTYEAVGTLDERFGIGMFEDDDYSRRVREKGYSIRCARDAFVHHWQMASFRKMPQEEYRALFDENRRRFTEKWGTAPPARPPSPSDPLGPQLRGVLERVAESRGAVIFLPSIGWGIHLVQRPHHLARALARRGFLVVFDCSNASDAVEGFSEVEPNLFLYRGAPERLHEIPSPIVWAFPYNFPAAEAYPAGARTVYDWIDDLEVFPYDRASLERNHERALKGASLVISVARRLHERAVASRPDALYVPNGVEPERFLASPPALADEALARFLGGAGPVAGYYGALARWFDYGLLAEVARQRPDWRFVLIGQDLDSSITGHALLARRNVLWLGPRDYAALPAYLAAFDVAMIPFTINAITLSTSPLKLFEYFAGGKPVVTTPMPECEAFSEVEIARDAGEFASALDRARERGRDGAFRERLRDLARSNTWDLRIDAVLAGLAGLAGGPDRAPDSPGRLAEPGFCNICGRETRFQGSDPSLDRESQTCAHCLATSRYRSIARGVSEAFRRLAGVDSPSLAGLPRRLAGRRIAVYDTQTPFSTGSSAYPIPGFLSRCGWIDLHLSTYRPSVPPGEILAANTTNQNLERLTFPDASFDLVITSDVMEHVRLEESAHREIRRVLRPGGIYLFTVPHFRNRETVARVEIVDPADPSRDRHLMEPEYHGDANSAEGRALAYRAFGIDLDEKLRRLGFTVEYTKQDFPENGIRNTELFFCRLEST